MKLPGRNIPVVFAALVSITLSASVSAAPTYISGHIYDVTFAGDSVMIRIDTGLPDNCVGSPYGWIKIPPEDKPMAAFVVGLWMRGDEASTNVTVYTNGLVGGYCQAGQLDPES